MHREDVFDIELLQSGHHRTQILVRRRSQVETADQRIDFLDTGDLLRVSERIDDAGMPAGADYDEAAIAQPEAGGVLMPMLVGPRLSGELVLGEMVVDIGLWVAAQ